MFKCSFLGQALGETAILFFFLVTAFGVVKANERNANIGFIVIDLKSHEKIMDSKVTLNDIAVVTSVALPRSAKLTALSLGTAPRDGHALTVSRDAIQHLLRVKFGLLENQIKWKGSLSSEIEFVQPVSETVNVGNAAAQYLKNWLAECADESTVEEPSNDVVEDIPTGKRELQVRPLAQGVRPTKNMRIWVDIFVDHHFFKTAPIDFKVSAYVSAWVAKEFFPAGSKLPLESFVVKRIDVARYPDSLIVRNDSAPFISPGSKLKLQHQMYAGEPLSTRNFELAPVIERGSPVLLKVQSGDVVLEDSGIAMENGKMGQTIAVKARSSSIVIKGRVVNAGLIEVQ